MHVLSKGGSFSTLRREIIAVGRARRIAGTHPHRARAYRENKLSAIHDGACQTRGLDAIEQTLSCPRDNILVIIVIMIRTQISLSEAEYEMAKAEAARLGISLAELLRRSLRHILPADNQGPWMRYAGMVETGERDASQKIDEIVYGNKK